jgi:hypothetical protein
MGTSTLSSGAWWTVIANLRENRLPSILEHVDQQEQHLEQHSLPHLAPEAINRGTTFAMAGSHGCGPPPSSCSSWPGRPSGGRGAQE